MKELNIIQKFFLILTIIIFFPFFLSAIATRRQRTIETRRKVKYFKPTVRQSFWGKKVSWELRDEPLTKDQMKKIKGWKVLN